MANESTAGRICEDIDRLERQGQALNYERQTR